ncbi:unnamed protein product [Cylicocyclus nassatus]|uniref:Uncharacterized protein n=1 Tax=Cylicocyclus nassatus TaxID=53992 RepID=A0AA36DJL0_CYLNA|nr:unnamed protein product [Cylicocyclus nassatus]
MRGSQFMGSTQEQECSEELVSPLSQDQKDELNSILDEWYTHRVQLEANLHGLAWHLDEWEKGTNTASAVGAFTGIGAAAVMVVGVIFPPLLLAGLALGSAAAVTNITTRVVKEENIKNQVRAAMALLEHDRQLTNSFINSVKKIETATVARLGRARTFMSDPLSGVVKAVTAISLAENITTAVRTIENITRGSRSETANKLRALADQLRGEAEEARRFLTENLAAV